MLPENQLHAFRVVLVAPLYSGNVGSVARLTMNFGVRDVVLVNPQCDPLNAEAQKFACKLSQNRLREFRTVNTLAEAIEDCPTVVGFSRRTGVFRIADVALDDVKAMPRDGRVALVFGREDNGISRDEILQCTHVCSIPSSSECPSLNLSHSVAVVLSRLYALNEKNCGSTPPSVEDAETKADIAISSAHFEELMTHCRETLLAVGLTEAGNPDRMMPHLRRIFQRARLSDKELRLIRGILGNTLIATGAKPRRENQTTKR
jgi:TrmH family RNA methyltransferase